MSGQNGGVAHHRWQQQRGWNGPCEVSTATHIRARRRPRVFVARFPFQPAPHAPHRRTGGLGPRFGVGECKLFHMPVFSTRMSVIALCAWATGTQLMMRSLPFVATIGKDGMAVQYGWDEADVGNFYASFGWGYSFSQIPGSMLAQQYGHKNVWLICLLGAALMNLFVPLAAGYGGLNAAMGVRFMFGIFQGPLFPIQTGILAAWLHEDERSTLNACVGLCWALFQAIQSAVTPFFMTGPGWEWAFVFCKSLTPKASSTLRFWWFCLCFWSLLLLFSDRSLRIHRQRAGVRLGALLERFRRRNHTGRCKYKSHPPPQLIILVGITDR